jgi:biotin transport system ATP-binding protein
MSTGIRLQNLELTLQGKPILKGLTLDLTERRIGIVGRNGSGKTSLLRVMAGLVAPTAGSITVAGHPPTDRKRLLGQLGILFQNPDHQILFPTVGEELAFGLIQQGATRAEAEARVMAALAAEGRADWLRRATHTLSQGQRQSICLMAVLLMEPAWILLDEPFAALDLPTASRLARRLGGLAPHLITITHDPATVETADRILWLEAGRLRADGPPESVLPAFRAEMALLGAQDADPDL